MLSRQIFNVKLDSIGPFSPQGHMQGHRMKLVRHGKPHLAHLKHLFLVNIYTCKIPTSSGYINF